MKRCSCCKVVKSFDSFSKNRSKKDGLQVTCKKCINENASYKLKKKDYYRSEKGASIHLNSHLKRMFNLTLHDKQEMFELQQGNCEICKRPFKDIKSACVDHNHETNKVRGLLCKPCNTFLGMIKENVKHLTTYIEKYK